MKKEPLIFVEHILQSIHDIEDFTKNIKTKHDLSQAKMAYEAVMRKIEIIGEAVKNLPASFRNKHDEIPWKSIAGMRDKLIHNYFDVVLILIVVVSCAPQMTDEELEAELAKLTPEEREKLLADLESKESGALAGQAYSAAVAKYKLPAKVATVSKAKVVLIAKKITLPTQCPNKCFVKVHLEPINNIDVSTKYFIEGSQYFYVGQESYWNWHISNCKEIDFGESVPVGPQGAGGIVREIYGCYKKQICGPEQEGTLSEDTGMIPCPYGCSNGACLPETTT